MTKSAALPGGGYKLGSHQQMRMPPDARWASNRQVRDRYGGKSQMWLWRKVAHDPDFPKPVYFGRIQMYGIAALDAYDELIKARSAAERGQT
jgi:hypothetical protein